MTVITKRFGGYPAAHRQPNHKGHCKWIHGHDWCFEVTFKAERLDSNGFVLDFGDMEFIKDFFRQNFDHTFLVAKTDPLLRMFKVLEEDQGAATLVLVDNPSAEGLAEYVWWKIQSMLESTTRIQERRVSVVKVICFEDSKNSATYERQA